MAPAFKRVSASIDRNRIAVSGVRAATQCHLGDAVLADKSGRLSRCAKVNSPHLMPECGPEGRFSSPVFGPQGSLVLEHRDHLEDAAARRDQEVFQSELNQENPVVTQGSQDTRSVVMPTRWLRKGGDALEPDEIVIRASQTSSILRFSAPIDACLKFMAAHPEELRARVERTEKERIVGLISQLDYGVAADVRFNQIEDRSETDQNIEFEGEAILLQYLDGSIYSEYPETTKEVQELSYFASAEARASHLLALPEKLGGSSARHAPIWLTIEPIQPIAEPAKAPEPAPVPNQP